MINWSYLDVNFQIAALSNSVDGVADRCDQSPIEQDSNEWHHRCQNQVPRQWASIDLVVLDEQVEVSRKPRDDVKHPVDVEERND